MEVVKLFSPDREARFAQRPNRFIILAQSEGEELRCHCPNPGRILEFAQEGMPLILEAREPGGGHTTAWTAAAVRYKGAIVPLAPSRMNAVAGKLVIPALFPDLVELRAEYSLGSSRFDFWGRDGSGGQHLIEVKTCSLVEEGLALFPDAPSARAVKHLKELQALAKEGYSCHVLFLVVHGDPRALAPNAHTDPDFAATLASVADRVDLKAAVIAVDEAGYGRLERHALPIDLGPGILAAEDRGSYLIVLELKEAVRLEVGSLGLRDFEAGWYVYAGSAQQGLRARVRRHLTKEKKAKHWHLDYLTPLAARLEALPIAGRVNLECELATALAGLGGRAVQAFGSSDCSCPSHLYWFSRHPLKDPAFVRVLMEFRHRKAWARA